MSSIVGGAINEGEAAVEKATDHAVQAVGSQIAGLLPVLEDHEIVIRISLVKKGEQ